MITKSALHSRIQRILSGIFGYRSRYVQEPEPIFALPRPMLEEQLTVPVAPLDLLSDAAQEARAHGRTLARKGHWDRLCAELRKADQARTMSPCRNSLAAQMAIGACSDIVMAARRALAEPDRNQPEAVSGGVDQLDRELNDQFDDPYAPLVSALAHIEIGQMLCLATPDHAKASVAHFKRAAKLIDPLCGLELNSPLTAEAQCRLLPCYSDAESRVADLFEDLIDLDPTNPRHLRSLGYHLLPDLFGSYARLEQAALEMAIKTGDVWGHGGYVWVWLDAISADPLATAHADPAIMEKGIRDILAARPDQAMANMLAAFCAVIVPNGGGPDCVEGRIAGFSDWVIRDHLREVQPAVWAQALLGFEHQLTETDLPRLAPKGRQAALQSIAHAYRREISTGQHLTLTAEGAKFTTI